MFTRTWKVYGRAGHRQAVSFQKSRMWDFSNQTIGVRIIDILNSDITGTNDYTIIRISRNTAAECKDELRGQISDGLFENVGTGKVIEICKEENK